MWTSISRSLDGAIDANTKTLEALKETKAAAEDTTQAGLLKVSLRGITTRANDLDTELRSLRLAILPAVAQEKENQE